jgi:hypothetical protein
VLGDKEMPSKTTQAMSGLRIQCRPILLAGKWDNMRMQSPEKLEGKDENLPGVRSNVKPPLTAYLKVDYE